METIQYHDYNNCLQLSNGEIEVVVAIKFGPRILGYNYVGGENVLGLHPGNKLETRHGEWRAYGGHRFWLAPENMPDTYAPDNSPLMHFFDEENNVIRLIQPIDAVSQTQKELTVSLDAARSGVKVHHKVTNVGKESTTLAPWALTIMRPGGEVFIPNEPFQPYGAETLLPVRNLTLWSYTDLSDLRWKIDREYTRLKVDADKEDAQKIGVLNKAGWIKYELPDVTFTKRFEHKVNASYPDMNSNTEVYTAGNFIEIETLAPLQRLDAGQSATHTEFWSLSKA